MFRRGWVRPHPTDAGPLRSGQFTHLANVDGVAASPTVVAARLGIYEAAKKLRITETTLLRWVSKGRIPCHRLGRKIRFTDEELAAAYQACPALAGRR